ncbi:MAG: cytochrome c family protein [Planctomycetota bacterium]
MNARISEQIQLLARMLIIWGGVNALFVLPSVCLSQEIRCDPTKVMTADSCAKCHGNEVKRWKQTPHYKTFEQLSRNPKTKEILSNLRLKSVKRSDVCIKCHYTLKEVNGKIKPVSGISCESCHGASRDWIALHNDYGGPTASRETETPEHTDYRYRVSSENGMRNTRNLYAIASSCLNCHTVPDEELVNVGGHKAGTEDFELVSWSQGMIRHNYLRNNGEVNTTSPPERLRKMFVIGIIAELEYSTRATAYATSKSNFGFKVAKRAARTAVKLYEIQQKINDPNVQAALESFASAELRINNYEDLNWIANQIRTAGEAFASQADGSQLAVLEPMMPDPSTYK